MGFNGRSSAPLILFGFCYPTGLLERDRGGLGKHSDRKAHLPTLGKVVVSALDLTSLSPKRTAEVTKLNQKACHRENALSKSPPKRPPLPVLFQRLQRLMLLGHTFPAGGLRPLSRVCGACVRNRGWRWLKTWLKRWLQVKWSDECGFIN